MALGTALAAVATIGGAALSASSTKKGANKAADTALQTTRENNALAENIYGQNKSALSPYINTGNAAMGQINALLGLNVANDAASGGEPDYAAYARANPDIVADYQQNVLPTGAFGSLNDYAKYHWDNYGQAEGRTTGAPTAPAAGDGALAAQNAFKQYQDSTGYQFRMGEGMNALNSGYAAKGLLNSGAAQKAALQYGQNIGSAEFGNYLGYLGNQQGLGLGGASALAGVGQNYVNTVSANNNSAGSAAANAALVKGTANGQMWGSIANGMGNVFGSSFSK